MLVSLSYCVCWYFDCKTVFEVSRSRCKQLYESKLCACFEFDGWIKLHTARIGDISCEGMSKVRTWKQQNLVFEWFFNVLVFINLSSCYLYYIRVRFELFSSKALISSSFNSKWSLVLILFKMIIWTTLLSRVSEDSLHLNYSELFFELVLFEMIIWTTSVTWGTFSNITFLQ